MAQIKLESFLKNQKCSTKTNKRKWSEHHPSHQQIPRCLFWIWFLALKGDWWGEIIISGKELLRIKRRLFYFSFWFICFVHICNSCFYIGIIHFKITNLKGFVTFWRVTVSHHIGQVIKDGSEEEIADLLTLCLPLGSITWSFSQPSGLLMTLSLP